MYVHALLVLVAWNEDEKQCLVFSSNKPFCTCIIIHEHRAVYKDNRQQYQLGRQPLTVALTVTVNAYDLFVVDSLFYIVSVRSAAQESKLWCYPRENAQIALFFKMQYFVTV